MKEAVDYTQAYSPVATQTGIRMSIGMALYYQDEDWDVQLCDIEAAFLETAIDTPMCIEWPDGMAELGFITEEEKRKFIILLQSGMHGNVDAAARYYEEFKKVVTDPEGMNMKQSLADPCIFYKIDLLTLVASLN